MTPKSSPLLIAIRRFEDDRGWFMETYSASTLARYGITDHFVQDNQSKSTFTGTVRGIHFQAPPYAQAKLVRCVRGSVIDYAVDLRRDSPTFGSWTSAELSEENGAQLFIPVGYGHAFVTLQPGTEVAYKVTDVYAPDCDAGVAWDDAEIGIQWPLPASGATLSEKDRNLPRLKDLTVYFPYDGNPMQPI